LVAFHFFVRIKNGNAKPGEDSFLMFRLYGVKPELWDRKWKPGDPKLVA